MTPRAIWVTDYPLLWFHGMEFRITSSPCCHSLEGLKAMNKEFIQQYKYYIGEGNGNPVQCSCLGNPMDRGACQATAHGVTKESDMT